MRVILIIVVSSLIGLPGAAEQGDTQAAIDRGVDFLATSLQPGGYWRANVSSTGAEYRLAMTGLAGLALLAAGETPTEGRHARALRSVLTYLLDQQTRQGGFLDPADRQAYAMYGHGFATLFLAEVHGMEGDRELHERVATTLAQAVAYIAAAQSQRGGWMYNPNPISDEGSVTVTQLQALRACHNAGIAVPESVVERAVFYLRHCRNKAGAICYSPSTAQRNVKGSLSLSAAGLVCMYAAGIYDDQLNDDLYAWISDQALGAQQSPCRAYRHAVYTRFYLSQALYMHGGEAWQGWSPMEVADLLGLQQADGSWPDGSVGSIFATVSALITLQLPQRRLPITQR